MAPDAFDIIDVSAHKGLSTDQRRNLGSIAKILQFAASNKGVCTIVHNIPLNWVFINHGFNLLDFVPVSVVNISVVQCILCQNFTVGVCPPVFLKDQLFLLGPAFTEGLSLVSKPRFT